MANPTALKRPPAGQRFDPTAIDATGATLGDVLTAVSDGSGGQRAGYAAPAAGFTTEQAQDAVGAMVADSATVSLTYTDATPSLVAAVVTGSIGPTQLASTAVTPGSYTNTDLTVDADGRITSAANGTAGTTYTDEQAQDAVGTILVDSSTIDFTYTDATPAITAAVIPAGIKLDDLGAPDDNTDLNVSTSAHGLTPKLPGGTTTFLRADGTYATPPGTTVAGALVLLESHTANNTATSLNFTTRNVTGQSGATFQSDFDDYLMEVVNLAVATNGAGITLILSTDGGATYDNSGIYVGQYQYFYTSSAATGGNPGNNGPIIVGSLVNTVNRGGVSGAYRFFNPLSASYYKLFWGTGVYEDSNVNQPLRLEVFSRYGSTTAVNAFQLIASTGNLTVGTVRLYGLAK